MRMKKAPGVPEGLMVQTIHITLERGIATNWAEVFWQLGRRAAMP